MTGTDGHRDSRGGVALRVLCVCAQKRLEARASTHLQSDHISDRLLHTLTMGNAHIFLSCTAHYELAVWGVVDKVSPAGAQRGIPFLA